MKRKGTALLLLLTLAILAVVFLALGDVVSFDRLKADQQALTATFGRNPIVFTAAFMALHATALGLCIPGSMLTFGLAGGAIFGAAWGMPVVLLGVVTGDCLGFLLARFVARDWVRRRFARQVAWIERGVARNGPIYLLALRLMGVVPFFLVNLGMGLTSMPLRVFAPVSLLAVTPATLLYVHAGTQLARIERPADVLSAELLASFALLALIPLAARKLFARRIAAPAP
jgi:uncharacterized membrane protein YdjX (TVP38/TMEM64 family)